LVTSAPEVATQQAGTILRGSGVGVIDIHRIDPALEDIFVSVLAKEREETHAHA
jgi:hypothetical protein